MGRSIASISLARPEPAPCAHSMTLAPAAAAAPAGHGALAQPRGAGGGGRGAGRRPAARPPAGARGAAEKGVRFHSAGGCWQARMHYCCCCTAAALLLHMASSFECATAARPALPACMPDRWRSFCCFQTTARRWSARATCFSTFRSWRAGGRRTSRWVQGGLDAAAGVETLRGTLYIKIGWLNEACAAPAWRTASVACSRFRLFTPPPPPLTCALLPACSPGSRQPGDDVEYTIRRDRSDPNKLSAVQVSWRAAPAALRSPRCQRPHQAACCPAALARLPHALP